MFETGGVWHEMRMGWPLHVVTPGKWKQHFGLARREWSNAERKAASRAHATRMFPSHADLFVRVKDDGRAEAALIALYGAEKMHVADVDKLDRMSA